MNTESALSGMRVLVTRPADQAASLCARIERCGGEAIRFPVIEIVPPRDPAALSRALDDLAEADLAVFVSANAVARVGALLRRRGLALGAARVAAVGPRTAAQCAREGVAVDFVARERIDSEGLLEALRDFDVADKKVLIFRGDGGRELIERALSARGASVRYVETYRRARADLGVAPLLTRWRARGVDAVAVTSIAVADALWRTLGADGRALLARTPIFAYSARVAEHCRKLGAAHAHAAARPDDDALVGAIIAWAARRMRERERDV
ncbi:MAG: uroporphyrinogen-III synthase [bacterium]